MSGHRWLLLGPAYAEEDGRPAAGSRPRLQKYDDSNCAVRFLAAPDRSLPFTDEDEVYSLARSLPRPLGPIPLEPGALPEPAERVLERTGIRRLYLDAHKRFYLVVCELHCDAAGLPNVERGAVCEAGFVVRRRRVAFPEAERRRARRLLGGVVRAEEALVRAAAPKIAFAPAGAAPAASVVAAAPVQEAARIVAERQLELEEWFGGVGGRRVLEGWVPDPELDGLGRWQEVAEEPARVEEEVFPLYPLVPDERDERHPAHGRAIWFGLVPTGSGDHEPDGLPRLDDSGTYEIRCFVRRHDPRCPRRLERGDCRGELVWSRPTEAYRLAPPLDLIGTSNRPVTVPMPDLPALIAQMKDLPLGPKLADGTRGPAPRGGGMPFKLVFPEGSRPLFDILSPSPVPFNPRLTGGLFCFEPIPLVTIVALVVYTIFKRIVVALFQLWPLDIGICLPLGLDVDAELLARVGLSGGGFSAGLSYGGGS